jgi:hypothetical protein
MAYNKNNYENNRLTPKQEEFCQQIMQGKTQYEAYTIAYPKSKNWKRNSVDCNASQLMEDTKIKQRLKEMGYKDTKKVEWTRKKALETINYVMDMNKKDIERIDEAYQTEIDLYEAKLLQKGQELANVQSVRQATQIAKEMQDITETIAKLKKQRRTSGTNIKGIYEGAKILNRMFGYDITKVEIKESDSTRDEAKQLSVEELKALAYANKDTGESTESD